MATNKFAQDMKKARLSFKEIYALYYLMRVSPVRQSAITGEQISVPSRATLSDEGVSHRRIYPSAVERRSRRWS